MRKKVFEYCDGNRIEVDIPKGFSFKEGKIEEGYVIEDSCGNQYVRIPAGYTTNGLYVRGFWISRFEISKNNDGEPCSVAGNYPATNLNWYEAKELAEKAGGKLLDAEEYDRVCMWLVQTKAATFEQVFITGNGVGNYSTPFKVAKTGSNQAWMVNNIDNFFGNCYTWTTERSELYNHHRIIRGGHGSKINTGDATPASCRAWREPEKKGKDIAIRIAIQDPKND